LRNFKSKRTGSEAIYTDVLNIGEREFRGDK
jgi:hypothetical protein